MESKEDELTFEREVIDNDTIFVPQNTWHNVKNTGDKPLKLYTIYAGQAQCTRHMKMLKMIQMNNIRIWKEEGWHYASLLLCW